MKKTTETKKTSTRSKKIQPVPEGFGTVTPYLIVDGADELIDFITDAFEGEVVGMTRSDGDRVAHAGVRIGNSMIMISDIMDEMPPELAMLYLYVEDADGTYSSALDAGAESIREPKDEFYGDRAAAVKDRWGNKWWIATQKEKVEGEELERRAREANKKAREEHAAH